MKGDVIIGLGLQCFDAECYSSIWQTSFESNISNEVVVIVDSQNIVELIDHSLETHSASLTAILYIQFVLS